MDEDDDPNNDASYIVLVDGRDGFNGAVRLASWCVPGYTAIELYCTDEKTTTQTAWWTARTRHVGRASPVSSSMTATMEATMTPTARLTALTTTVLSTQTVTSNPTAVTVSTMKETGSPTVMTPTVSLRRTAATAAKTQSHSAAVIS